MTIRLSGLGALGFFIRQRFLPSRRPIDRGSHPQGAPLEILKLKYYQSGLESKPDTFVLYRIIGNDLPPRHNLGQSRKNLTFILEHEPDLPGCEKRFIVNRIANREEEKTIISILEQAKFPFRHIPFRQEEYSLVSWDTQAIPLHFAPYTQRFNSLSQFEQNHLMMRLYRLKNNYVMHNNGARNVALNEGRSLAKWVLPWDGNCFFTIQAWAELRSAVTSHPEIPFYIVPMARITDNSLLLQSSFRPPAHEEPQIVFRCDTSLEFNPEYPYGRRPKVEMLWRLGVPGKWDSWILEPWDLPCPQYATEAGSYRNAGWVARLFSGRKHFEKGLVASGSRGIARSSAIISFLDTLSDHSGSHNDKPVFAPINSSHHEADSQSKIIFTELFHEAEQTLLREPFSFSNKVGFHKSIEQGYRNPVPIFWPFRPGMLGLPIILKKNQNALENKFLDRCILQRMFQETFILALAWNTFKDVRYANNAARLVRLLFLERKTSIHPNLGYTWVTIRNKLSQRANSEIIATKNFHLFLDSLRILRIAGILSSGELNQFSTWLEHFLYWLQNSRHGRQERRSTNNHGTYYDLQVAAIAAFLNERQVLRQTLLDSRFRIQQQFDNLGRQPEEMHSDKMAHYCSFNLQGWVYLSQLAEAEGEDLWHHEGPQGECMRKAMEWLFSNVDPKRHYKDFDLDRLAPLY